MNKFISLDSDMVLGVRYDADTHSMDVVFRTGDKYRYKRVPQEEYEGLLEADSHGQYMHKNILGHYEYERFD